MAIMRRRWWLLASMHYAVPSYLNKAGGQGQRAVGAAFRMMGPPLAVPRQSDPNGAANFLKWYTAQWGH